MGPVIAAAAWSVRRLAFVLAGGTLCVVIALLLLLGWVMSDDEGGE